MELDEVDVVAARFAEESFDHGHAVVARFVVGDAAFGVAPDFRDQHIAVARLVFERLGDHRQAAVGVGAIEQAHSLIIGPPHGIVEVFLAGSLQGIAAVAGLHAGAHAEQRHVKTCGEFDFRDLRRMARE